MTQTAFYPIVPTANGSAAGAYDTNFGTVGAQTLRTASELGNATGAVDYNTGVAGAQTIRTVICSRSEAVATPLAVQQSNGTSAIDYNTGAASAATPRSVLATRHEAVATPLAATLSSGAAAVDYNYGTVGASTLRTAAHVGNATGIADYNNGAAGAQTLRVATSANSVASNGAVGSVTGSALTGSYATVVTPGFAARVVLIFNSCNQTIKVSLDGGTTDFFILEAGESPTIDLAANGRQIAASTALQAKHNGAAPTSGTIRISAIG